MCLPSNMPRAQGFFFVGERESFAFKTDKKMTIMLGAQDMYLLSGQLLKYLDNFRSKCMVNGG